jgi:nitrite reductase/ring-hydroxylating ferredoxin subunit
MERDRQDVNTNLNRRQFLILAAAVVTDPKALEKGNPTVAYAERTIDTGPISHYASDGMYTGFSDQGFFVVRKGQKLQALSAFCTHRKCKLTAESDLSFYCKCHGSTFDPSGKVTEGPARRNLPMLSSFVNENGHLLVKVPA